MLAFKKILFPTDCSANAGQALAHAVRLADFDGGEVIVQHVVGQRIFNATVYMLYVIETSYAVGWAIRQTHLTNAMDKLKEWARNQLLNLTPNEFAKDPTVIRLVETGSPGDTIAQVAYEVGANLTILGTHEYGSVHKYLIGTTTDKLLTTTSTPLLTVKV